MNPAHNQLAVMEGRNATTCAGQLGPVKQNQVTIEEANAAHGITRHGDVALTLRQRKTYLPSKNHAFLSERRYYGESRKRP